MGQKADEDGVHHHLPIATDGGMGQSFPVNLLETSGKQGKGRQNSQQKSGFWGVFC